ncbi:MAG: FAD-dependent oxidoreductase [Clostridiales Family XIII bacterium]|jgi:2,4-dienoyl-CoA reductase-like NADH-dependent reductase (Old Yellow Enzyme family)/thioredoxin reductase|nr:FAD-dependent oxidoreductase [Clostridiales Family XIII bacterium]
MQDSILFTPLNIGGLTLKNRLLSAPTSLAQLSPEGYLTPESIRYYELRAAGGCAAVTVGDAVVKGATGRSHPSQILLDDEGSVFSLTQVADAIHSHGAAASIELDHGGALCDAAFVVDGRPRGPSDIILDWGACVYALSETEIEEIADDFAHGAEIIKRCGFDMLMIHGGHGWLLHQFLSPLTNKRTDKYGGSIENRMRFPLLVIERVRAAVGRDFPIEFRMSADERMPDGFDCYGADTGIRIAEMLDGNVDLIHVSVGNNYHWESTVLMHPGCFQMQGENSHYATEIKRHVNTPVTTVGAFTDVDFMESFIKSGGADAIALGRALIADPFLPKKALLGRADDITPCLRCGECQGSMWATRTIRCSVNPLIGREYVYFSPPPIAETKKRVLVAGGGPGGLTAATESAKRGHDVVLCDSAEALGGALFFADGVGFKESIVRLRKVLSKRAEDAGIDIRLGTYADKDFMEQEKPDVVIAAVGSVPIVPPIAGADAPHVLLGANIRADTEIGHRVVIIGGGLIGCEIGLHLAEDGHEVTIIEMQDEVAPEATPLHRHGLLMRIRKVESIRVETGLRATSIEQGCVRAESKTGTERVFDTDTIILSAGMKANTDEIETLRDLAPEFYQIGDCRKARRIMQAIAEGYDAAVDISLPY